MWFLLVPFVLKEPCSRPGDPDIALQSNLPRCLLSPTSNEMPNSQLCPDITGSIIPKNRTDDTVDGSFNGAFYKLSSGGKGAWSADDSENAQYGLGFRARYSDSTYGQSSGVSVPACYALIIIKA